MMKTIRFLILVGLSLALSGCGLVKSEGLPKPCAAGSCCSGDRSCDKAKALRCYCSPPLTWDHVRV
jgi:uncharacterized protein YceK